MNEASLHLKAMKLEKPEWLKHLQEGASKKIKAYAPEQPFLEFRTKECLIEFAYSLSSNTEYCNCKLNNPLTQCKQEKCDWYVPVVRLTNLSDSKQEEFKYSGIQRSLN